MDMHADRVVILAADDKAGKIIRIALARTAHAGPVAFSGQGGMVPAGLLSGGRAHAEQSQANQRCGSMRSHLFP